LSEAFPDINLVVAAEGILLNECKKFAKDLKLPDRAIFTGLLSEQELLNLLHKSLVYIHSSKAETLSTCILQAMLTGLPIVASNILDMRNLIENNESGLLFELGNHVH